MRKMLTLMVFSAAFLGLTSLPATGTDSAVTIEPLAVNSTYVTASGGNWSYAGSYGYVWRPQMMEAEWSPLMDAPFDHGRWVFIPGWGYAWSPVIPPWSMSPLGWGYDSWYGGWYGFLPNGNWSGIMGDGPYGGSNPYLWSRIWVGRVAPPIAAAAGHLRPAYVGPMRLNPKHTEPGIAVLPDGPNGGPRHPKRGDPDRPTLNPHHGRAPSGGTLGPKHQRTESPRGSTPRTGPSGGSTQQPRYVPSTGMSSGGSTGGGTGGGGHHHR